MRHSAQNSASAQALQGRLAVVLLHYGPAARTAALHRQLAASDPDWRESVLVLDNHADEPYPEAWRRADENLYWAGALDFAIKTLAKTGITHLWFLNNDLTFDSPPPHIARAWGRLAHIEKQLGRVGVYAPSVLHNPYHAQMVRQEGSQWRGVAYVDGIAPILSLACLAELGGLDCRDNPFGYGVDVWLSLRAQRAGWAVVVDDQVAVRHRYHSTAKEIEGFLARAAAAEEAYLTARLGPDWRAVLKDLQK
jgi:GT2 family glycosyltransferase